MKNIFFFTCLFLYSNSLAYQETIQHGELFLRESTDTVGSGVVEMTASAEEEAIEITYTVTRNRRGFCPVVDTYLVQNEIAIALTECEVEYTPSSWAGCGEITEGITSYVKIKQFPEWFDFCSDFRFFFGIWDLHDYVDVLACSTPIITTTTTVFTTTTTSLREENCPVEELYGKASEETKLLRYLRDSVLSETPEGQKLIRLYYTIAPAITRAMGKDAHLKEDLKALIDEALSGVRAEVR